MAVTLVTLLAIFVGAVLSLVSFMVGPKYHDDWFWRKWSKFTRAEKLWLMGQIIGTVIMGLGSIVSLVQLSS